MKNKGRKQHGTTGEVSQRTARELRKELGYARWEKFSKIIEKAMKMCRNEGQEVAEHSEQGTAPRSRIRCDLVKSSGLHLVYAGQ